MTNEIRSPSVEGRSGVQWLVRHSDFGLPSDFVIRHSGLRTIVFGRSVALSAQPRFLSLSSSKRRRGPGRGGAFINSPSLRLSPRSFLARRERQNTASLLRAEHNWFENCGSWKAPFRFLRTHWGHEPLRRNSGTGVSPVRFVRPTHGRDARATTSRFMASPNGPAARPKTSRHQSPCSTQPS
jgi:hypothetical protein